MNKLKIMKIYYFFFFFGVKTAFFFFKMFFSGKALDILLFQKKRNREWKSAETN